MTKLQILNAFMTERLMVAVQEILEVIGNTMSEYQQETTRIKRENESLKWKLREVGLEAETTWETDAQLAALPVMRGRRKMPKQRERMRVSGEDCGNSDWRLSRLVWVHSLLLFPSLGKSL
ncbi:hypothetical protein COCON_G00031350 [Conger conger]|uniref:Uncharacterized protein n=1 Tax=Conger conger TaxID=82655 RepID=A0A9Q1DYR3_CONCO|nr:hypothetical protein COCON_G00031350 [Conger conger]